VLKRNAREKGHAVARLIVARLSLSLCLCKINCGNARAPAISARWTKRRETGERATENYLSRGVKKIALLTRCRRASRSSRDGGGGKLNGEFFHPTPLRGSNERIRARAKDSGRDVKSNGGQQETEEWQAGDYRVAGGKRALKISRAFKCRQSSPRNGNALCYSPSLFLFAERVRQHLLQARKHESEIQNEKVPTESRERVNEESTELARSLVRPASPINTTAG